MNYTYILKGLDCANCAAKIENSISKIDGISEVSVNFITTKLSFTCDSSLFNNIIFEIKKTINNLEPDINVEVYL